MQAWGSLVSWLLGRYQDFLDAKMRAKVFDAKSIMQIDKDKGGTVTEVEFVTHMLLKTQKVDQLTLRSIQEKFAAIDIGGDGKISRAELEQMEAKENEKNSTPNSVVPVTEKTPRSSEAAVAK